MEWSLIIRAIERILIVSSGMLSLCLGYFLFIKGLSGKASLKAEYNKSKIQLVNAAPGIFFALFGTVILVVSVWRIVAVEVTVPTTSIAEPQLIITGLTTEEIDAVLQLLDDKEFKGVIWKNDGDEWPIDLKGARKLKFWGRGEFQNETLDKVDDGTLDGNKTLNK